MCTISLRRVLQALGEVNWGGEHCNVMGGRMASRAIDGLDDMHSPVMRGIRCGGAAFQASLPCDIPRACKFYEHSDERTDSAKGDVNSFH